MPGTLQHSAPMANSSMLGPWGGASKNSPACLRMISAPMTKTAVSRM